MASGNKQGGIAFDRLEKLKQSGFYSSDDEDDDSTPIGDQQEKAGNGNEQALQVPLLKASESRFEQDNEEEYGAEIELAKPGACLTDTTTTLKVQPGSIEESKDQRADQTALAADPASNDEASADILAREEEQERNHQKMVKLQQVVQEHARKLVKLEKVLAQKNRDKDAANLSDVNPEEVERLIDSLKESMVLHQNQLKFLINAQTCLEKNVHVDQVCEAFFESEKTWFAALIQDVDEDAQEAEVAWIGYNIQEKLPVEKVTILEIPHIDDLFVGAKCNAVYPSDGMWYEATVERILSEEESETFAASDFRAAQTRLLVRYKASGSKQTVPIDYLRISSQQQLQNQSAHTNQGKYLDPATGQANPADPLGNPMVKYDRKKVGTGTVSGSVVQEFQFPEHLRQTKNDSDKTKEQKKKKVKALKYAHKTQMFEQDAKFKQNEWNRFQRKGSKQSSGHFAFGRSAQSIFKSPDCVGGKVGVINSGKSMTEYLSQKRKLNPNSQLDQHAPPSKRPHFN